jgi:hypothetical protein
VGDADRVCVSQATGVEFPEVQNLWGSTDPYRSVGAGVREKKIAFISVKVGVDLKVWCSSPLTIAIKVGVDSKVWCSPPSAIGLDEGGCGLESM